MIADSDRRHRRRHRYTTGLDPRCLSLLKRYSLRSTAFGSGVNLPQSYGSYRRRLLQVRAEGCRCLSAALDSSRLGRAASSRDSRIFAPGFEPTARMIVVENVIPEGASFHSGKWIDLQMLVCVGGRERTETEYRPCSQTQDSICRKWLLQRPR